MLTNGESSVPSNQGATSSPAGIPIPGLVPEDIKMDDPQSADQICLTTLLQQQREATTCKHDVTR